MQLNDQTRKLLTIFGCILLALFLLVVCIWVTSLPLSRGLPG